MPPDLEPCLPGPLHTLKQVPTSIRNSESVGLSAILLGGRMQTMPTFSAAAPDLHHAALLLKLILGSEGIKPQYQDVTRLRLLLEKNEELHQLLKDSWERQDCTRLKSFAFWYVHETFQIAMERKTGTIMNTVYQRKALANAWQAPYQGNLHKLLRNNINYEFRLGRRRTRGNHSCLVQGSGCGKSRTINELANHVLLIPLNFRISSSEHLRSYPDADEVVRDHFLGASWLSSAEQKSFLWSFFCETLNYVYEHIEQQSYEHKVQYEGLAMNWSSFLKNNRQEVYAEIVRRHNKHFEDIRQTSLNVSSTTGKGQVLRSNVKGSLRRLLELMDQCVHESERLKQTGCVKIICSVDEADVLALTSVPGNEQEGNLYEAFCTSLDVFRGLPIFFLFLSTNSQIALLAPPKRKLISEDAKKHFTSLIAPFTETPFNCSPNFPLDNVSYRLEEITTIGFMAQLGRPLWHSILHAMQSGVAITQTQPSSRIRTRAQTRAHMQSDPSASSMANLIVAEILPLARTKLLCCESLPEPSDRPALHRLYTPLRKRVLADVRVSLTYEPSREKTYDELANMVASHMKMVYSVPQHREYMRSGYSSEPILAEAAAQELRVLRTSGVDGDITLPQIVASAIDNDLCSVGERGEVVGRTLVTLAYERAVESESRSLDGSVHYSAGCSLIGFIKELFPEKFAEEILDSHPDNAGTKQTMRDAFKDAHVRFTHFARLGDDGGITPQALFAAFLRGHAQLGHPTQEKIDVAIPVVLDKDKICVDNMTVLLISIKRRAMEGTKAEYEICADALGVFIQPFVTSLKDHPYIALVMELGVQGRARYTIGQRHIQRPSSGSAAGGLDGFTKPVKAAPSIKTPRTPARMALGRFAERRGNMRSQNEPLTHHPRYNIYAYGCSPDIYKVIGEDERGLYRKLLADRDLFAEHPRKKVPGSIRAMLRQKPVLYTNLDSFHWVGLNPQMAEALRLEKLEEERIYGPDAVFAGQATKICDTVTGEYLFGFPSNKTERQTKDNSESGGNAGASFLRGGQPRGHARRQKEYFESYDSEPEEQDGDEIDDERENCEDIFAAEDRRMKEELSKRRWHLDASRNFKGWQAEQRCREYLGGARGG
ncbi:hypothetical protein CERSUDRAFT_127211 [Gelatoporia subvermispora B]|uniref:Uncharacterized protein n=1 Tax=Ceriporiopsis subvermispora (strain B) TaxID=914234 RepID=M2QIC0_CERS8|nr:hypothetical protein CERSUDRAFT_127211 [Gelatoporia subvermispora B]